MKFELAAQGEEGPFFWHSNLQICFGWFFLKNPWNWRICIVECCGHSHSPRATPFTTFYMEDTLLLHYLLHQPFIPYAPFSSIMVHHVYAAGTLFSINCCSPRLLHILQFWLLPSTQTRQVFDHVLVALVLSSFITYSVQGTKGYHKKYDVTITDRGTWIMATKLVNY